LSFCDEKPHGLVPAPVQNKGAFPALINPSEPNKGAAQAPYYPFLTERGAKPPFSKPPDPITPSSP